MFKASQVRPHIRLCLNASTCVSLVGRCDSMNLLGLLALELSLVHCIWLPASAVATILSSLFIEPLICSAVAIGKAPLYLFLCLAFHFWSCHLAIGCHIYLFGCRSLSCLGQPCLLCLQLFLCPLVLLLGTVDTSQVLGKENRTCHTSRRIRLIGSVTKPWHPASLDWILPLRHTKNPTLFAIGTKSTVGT